MQHCRQSASRGPNTDDGVDFYQIAKNCRASVEMIEKKTTLPTSGRLWMTWALMSDEPDQREPNGNLIQSQFPLEIRDP